MIPEGGHPQAREAALRATEHRLSAFRQGLAGEPVQRSPTGDQASLTSLTRSTMDSLALPKNMVVFSL